MTTAESPYVQDALAIDYTPDDDRFFDRQRSRASDLPDPGGSPRSWPRRWSR